MMLASANGRPIGAHLEPMAAAACASRPPASANPRAGARIAGNREEKVLRARTLLAEAVGRLQSGDDWRELLTKMAKNGGPLSPRRYSFLNQLLLLAQHPDPWCVATYVGWQRAGRQVRKGERGLLIYAPRHAKRAKDTEESDGDAGDEEGPRVRFWPMAVFAGDQTDPLPGDAGRPLPERVSVTKDVTAPEAFAESVEILREVALRFGADVVTGIELREWRPGDPPQAGGWYDPANKTIVVIMGETPRAQIFKTLVHELGHAILHGAGDHHATPVQEVEAESTAFVVCSALGLDTHEFSFPYVAFWSRGEDAQAMVLRSGDRIVSAANRILQALVPDEEAGTDADEANES